MFVKCFSIRQEIWYVTNPPDMPTGKVQLPRVCKISATSLDAILNISNSERCISWGCYKGDVCNSRISKISILHANPWSLSFSGKIFLYFCNKLPFWRPFCLNSYFVFIFLLEVKCLQLDFNFIADNLRKKMGLRHFSISHKFFTYN